MRKPVYWGLECEGELTCTDPDEVVTEWLEDAWPTPPEELPETIEICGCAHVEIDQASVADLPLSRLLEYLDEEYGDPEGGYSEPTEAMKRAAVEFARAVVTEYDVWRCEVVETMTIHVGEWIVKNEPGYAAECRTDRAEQYRARMRRLAEKNRREGGE